MPLVRSSIWAITFALAEFDLRLRFPIAIGPDGMTMSGVISCSANNNLRCCLGESSSCDQSACLSSFLANFLKNFLPKISRIISNSSESSLSRNYHKSLLFSKLSKAKASKSSLLKVSIYYLKQSLQMPFMPLIAVKKAPSSDLKTSSSIDPSMIASSTALSNLSANSVVKMAKY